MRSIVTVDEITKELPLSTKAAEGSVLKGQMLEIAQQSSGTEGPMGPQGPEGPKGDNSNIIIVSSIEDVPSGTPNNTLVVVTS